MKLQPMYDRIVVRRIEKDTKTPGGIIIPDQAAEKPLEGEVLAVGFGYRGKDGSITPLCVQEGAKVLFGRHAGVELEVEGEEVLVLREEDLLGVVND